MSKTVTFQRFISYPLQKSCIITSIFQMINFSFSICNTQKTVTLPFTFVGFFNLNLSENITKRFAEGKGSTAHYVSDCTFKAHHKESTVAAHEGTNPPCQAAESREGHRVFQLITTKIAWANDTVPPWPVLQRALKTSCESGTDPEFGVPQQTSTAAWGCCWLCACGRGKLPSPSLMQQTTPF